MSTAICAGRRAEAHCAATDDMTSQAEYAAHVRARPKREHGHSYMPPPSDLHTECLSTISDLRDQISELTRSEAEYKQAYETSHRQNCDLTATIHQLTERLENK